MATLKLTLKKEWFDLIESGDKKEEYREIKPYWYARLVFKHKQVFEYNTGAEWDESNDKQKRDLVKFICNNKSNFGFKPFDFVEFKNGYGNVRKVLVELKGIKIGNGKEKWGAKKDKIYFVLELGNVIF